MLSPDYYEETSSGAKLLSEISCLLDEKTGSDVFDWQEAMFWNAGIYGMSICRKIIWLNTLKSKMLMIQKQCSLLAAYLKSNRFVLVKVWQKKAVK